MRKISIKKVEDKFHLSVDDLENPEDLGIGISLSRDEFFKITGDMVFLAIALGDFQENWMLNCRIKSAKE